MWYNTFISMGKKIINFLILYKKYRGQWVALGDDEKTVFAAGKTAKEVLQASRKSGHKDPILYRVPSEISFPSSKNKNWGLHKIHLMRIFK